MSYLFVFVLGAFSMGMAWHYQTQIVGYLNELKQKWL